MWERLCNPEQWRSWHVLLREYAGVLFLTLVRGSCLLLSACPVGNASWTPAAYRSLINSEAGLEPVTCILRWMLCTSRMTCILPVAFKACMALHVLHFIPRGIGALVRGFGLAAFSVIFHRSELRALPLPKFPYALTRGTFVLTVADAISS